MGDPALDKYRKRPPRVTIRLIMVAVVVAAVDFALAAALQKNYPLAAWGGIAFIVGLYDLLVVLIALVPGKLMQSPGENRLEHAMKLIAASTVLLLFAGFPLAVAIYILLGGRW